MKFDDMQYKTISLVQAAGIVSVVLGHLSNQPFDVIHPYVFHMPLFFFLGGLLLSVKNGFFLKIKNILKKHGLYLLKSYIITGIISLILVYYFNVEKRKPFSDGIIETLSFTIKNNFGNNGLFVVGWFLFSYIIASTICSAIAAGTRNITYRKSAYLFICATFFYLGIVFFPSLHIDRSHYIANLSSQVFTASAFMLLGYTSKDYIFQSLRLDVSIFLFMAMIIIKNAGLQKGVNIAWSSYPIGLCLSIITSLSAIYILFCFCYAFSNFKGVSGLILYASRNTKTIMTYHIFAFFVIDLIFSKLGFFEEKRIATYSHYSNINAWPLYVFAGIAIPLMMCFIHEILKKLLSSIMLLSNKKDKILPY